MILYTLMDISALYQLFTRNPYIVTDSRSSVKNSIFFGLRGERFNGNRFAAEALNKGALYAVVDDPEVIDGDRYILVGDSLATLQELAAFHRNHLDIPLIAITGSNGKTTTKELAAGILSTQYRVKATSGNLNNHIGVPLTLLGMDGTTEIGIVEMGANHPGEIALLCRLARPDYGLITNIGHAHLEGFGNIDGVKKAKGELYEYLEENGGLIFCNAEDETLREMLESVHTGIMYYGAGNETVCSGEVLSANPFLSFRLRLRNTEYMELETLLVGSYNLENILAAVALGLHFRIIPDNIFHKLQGWSSGNNRSQRVETDRNVLILDAYNANPTSMILALESFNLQDHQRKVLILGDMLELGENAGQSHEAILKRVVEMDCHEVFLVGPIFSAMQLPGEIRAFGSVEELEGWLGRHPLENRLILLKGSRGISLERLRDSL